MSVYDGQISCNVSRTRGIMSTVMQGEKAESLAGSSFRRTPRRSGMRALALIGMLLTGEENLTETIADAPHR